MNIFLTGASGYIGRRVAEKLQAAGHQLVGLARSDHAVQWMQEQGITPHRGDLFDAPSLTQAALLADGVIHLGAAVGPAWAEGDRIAVHALLDALAGSGNPFVYTSGTPIYGDTGLTVVDEDAPLNPPPFFAWRPRVEQQVLATASQDVRSIVLRPATVYGRGEVLPCSCFSTKLNMKRSRIMLEQARTAGQPSMLTISQISMSWRLNEPLPG